MWLREEMGEMERQEVGRQEVGRQDRPVSGGGRGGGVSAPHSEGKDSVGGGRAGGRRADGEGTGREEEGGVWVSVLDAASYDGETGRGGDGGGKGERGGDRGSDRGSSAMGAAERALLDAEAKAAEDAQRPPPVEEQFTEGDYSYVFNGIQWALCYTKCYGRGGARRSGEMATKYLQVQLVLTNHNFAPLVCDGFRIHVHVSTNDCRSPFPPPPLPPSSHPHNYPLTHTHTHTYTHAL